MTRNLYLGADLGPAISATGFADFIEKNGQILRDVDTNNFRVRARGLAAEIRSVRPDLVGLQEVALWRLGVVNLPAAAHRGLPQGQGGRHAVHRDHGQIRLPEAATEPAQQGQEALPGGQGAEGIRLRGAGRLRRQPEHRRADRAISTAG